MDVGKVFFSVVVGFVPDAAIAWGYMRLTEGSSREFWIAVIVLQCVYLFLWLKRTVWAWLVFILYACRAMQRNFEKGFEECQYPCANQFVDGLSHYLSEIIHNQTLPVETRLKASRDLGAFAQIGASGHFTAALMMDISSRRAIAKYSRLGADDWTIAIQTAVAKAIAVVAATALGALTLAIEIYAADNFPQKITELFPFLLSIPFFPFGLLLVFFCILLPFGIGVFAYDKALKWLAGLTAKSSD